MFDKKLKDQIAALEAEKALLEVEKAELERQRVEDQIAASNQHYQDIKALRERAEAEAEGLRAELALLRKSYDEDEMSWKLKAAGLEAVIATLKSDGEKLAAVLRNHDWHRAGSVAAHGRTLELWECVHCKADPLANTRLLVPEGWF